METPSEMKLLYFAPAPPKASIKSLPQESWHRNVSVPLAQEEAGFSSDTLAYSDAGKD